MSTSDEEMLVVRSLRQAFESYGGPGSSVNATQNPFFIQLTGQFDLLKAAQLTLVNLETQRRHKERLAKEEAVANAARVAREKAAEPDPLA